MLIDTWTCNGGVVVAIPSVLVACFSYVSDCEENLIIRLVHAYLIRIKVRCHIGLTETGKAIAKLILF